VSGH
jgi:hypothetical protein